MFAEGAIVAGKYRLDRLLGRGGMGLVASATHVHLGQRVALKFLHPDHAVNPHVVERFTREARASAALRSEHVCRVSDVGTLEDGSPYLVMELLEGTDLSRLNASQGPLSVARTAEYVLQACIGIAEAHHLGIVHRDLKPANLFLSHTPDGAQLVKVLDFGIAKAQADTGDFSLTKTSSVLGSPGYMSPEQLKSSRDVDHRSDIWSLGVILFELVAKQAPFKAASITELAIRVSMDARAPLPIRVPVEFERIIDTCLEKDPRGRYSDLAQFAAALAPFAGPHGSEHASRVARMLGVLPSAMPSAMLGPALSHDVAPTVPPTGYAHPLTQQPTTLGSSNRSYDTPVPTSGGGRRWGVIAGVSLAVIAVGVGLAIATSGGTSTPGTTNTVTAPPPPQPDAAAVAPDVALVPDAEIAVASPDAAEPEPDAMVATPEPPADAKKVIKKRPTGGKPTGGEDVGESRK